MMGKRKWIKPEIRGYSGGVGFWGCIMPATLVAQMIRLLENTRPYGAWNCDSTYELMFGYCMACGKPLVKYKHEKCILGRSQRRMALAYERSE